MFDMFTLQREVTGVRPLAQGTVTVPAGTPLTYVTRMYAEPHDHVEVIATLPDGREAYVSDVLQEHLGPEVAYLCTSDTDTLIAASYEMDAVLVNL